MSGGVGGFIAGLEGLSFVERLSDRFETPPHTVVRVAGVLVGLIVVVLAWLAFSQSGQSATETLELESESESNLIQASTRFDNENTSSIPAVEVTPTQDIVVYVTGAVANPGLYTLTSDDRIGDAVQAAGGLLPEAAAAVVNLAQQISDGMQIHIPRTDEVQSDAPASGLPGAGATGDASSVAGANDSSGLVNINTADSVTLQTLEGIGPATAQKILDYRAAHGPFQSKEELKNVSGIGEKKYAAIQARITV